jgi:hypothetical protein
LALNGGLPGIAAGIVHDQAWVEVDLMLAPMHVFSDLGGYLAADYGAHVLHEPLGFPQVATFDRLRATATNVSWSLVVQIRGSQLPA